MRPRKALANLARRVLKTVGFRSVTRTVYGGPIRIPIAVGELKSLLFDPTYAPFLEGEEIMDLLFEKIRPEDVVFDIGGWHGIHATVFARTARQVISFEPNPPTFRILKETVAVNKSQRITPYQLAVGSEASTADLWGSGSGSSLRPGHGKVARNRVQVVTLDDFADTISTVPDVLKIDVEGAEYHVLAGARRCLQHVRLVCIELHFEEIPKFDVTPQMVYAAMADAGFTEIASRTPHPRGKEDRSRVHVLFEKVPQPIPA